MNEEQNAKLNWCFEALKFLLKDNVKDIEEFKYGDKLLEDSDRIEIDYTKEEEQSLPEKTEVALGRKEE